MEAFRRMRLRILLVALLLVLGFLFISELRSPTGLLSVSSVNQSSCFTASTAGVVGGDTVYLNASITQGQSTACVVLDVSNVSFDCQGFSIIGNQGSGAAIEITADDVSVSNCTIANYTGEHGRGIVAENVGGVSLTNNHFSDNGRIIVSGSGNSVINNVFSQASIMHGVSAGVQFSGSGILSDNRIEDGSTMTIVVSGQNITLRDNVVNNSIGEAFKVNSSLNVTLINNTAGNFTGICFTVEDSSNVSLINNTVSFVNKLTRNALRLFFPNIPETSEAGIGFRILNSNYTVLQGNGVDLDNSIGEPVENVAFAGLDLFDVTLFNNNFSDTRDCAFFVRSDLVNVSGNRFMDCTHKGIVLQDSPGALLDDNSVMVMGVDDVYDYRRGIEVFRSDNASVHNNVIAGFASGLYVFSSHFGDFSDNNITALVHGVFSMQSSHNDFQKINVSSSRAGLKLFLTNSSLFNNSYFSGSLYSLDLDSSFNNNITFDTFVSSFAHISHNSAFNNLSDNTFNTGASFDVVFDLFANNNNGTGNVLPNGFTEKNFAGNNLVT